MANRGFRHYDVSGWTRCRESQLREQREQRKKRHKPKKRERIEDKGEWHKR